MAGEMEDWMSRPVLNSEALQWWKRKPSEESSEVNPFDQPKITDHCAEQGLRPAMPQMTRKLYHITFTGKYSHFKLLGTDPGCAMSAKKLNGRGVLNCLRPDIPVRTLISDIYEDACGNLFRGVFEREFFRRHETMETLFSPGRSTVPRPGSAFKEERMLAPSSPVSASDFLFFIPLLPGDEEAIQRDLKNAQILGLEL